MQESVAQLRISDNRLTLNLFRVISVSPKLLQRDTNTDTQNYSLYISADLHWSHRLNNIKQNR